MFSCMIKYSKELFIFDFDGTLFHNPCPLPLEKMRSRVIANDQVNQEDSVNLHNRNQLQIGDKVYKYSDITKPQYCGGLGWFQDVASLSAPYIPTTPAYTTDSPWYISSITSTYCNLLNSNVMLEHPILHQSHIIQYSKLLDANVVVMTGRENYFRSRLLHILSCIHPSLPQYVILKDNVKNTTVKYKIETIIRQFLLCPAPNRGIDSTSDDVSYERSSIETIYLYEDRIVHAAQFTKVLKFLGGHAMKESVSIEDKQLNSLPSWATNSLAKYKLAISSKPFQFCIVMPTEKELESRYLSQQDNENLLLLLHKNQRKFTI